MKSTQGAGQHTYLHNVYFTDEHRGWILGFENDQGLLFQSTDGGESWRERYRTPERLSKIKFATEKIGWIVGSDEMIIRTSDGGIKWVRQCSGTKMHLTGLAVIDDKNAWATGAYGTLLYTKDSGETCNKRNINSRVAISDIVFVDAEYGWAVGYGTIFSTTDGGSTWALKSSGEWKPLGSVFFADHHLGWIAVGPVILRTTDGGNTWNETLPPSQGQTTSLSFVDAQYGWLAKSRGEEGSVAHVVGHDRLSSESFILSTRDGGSTWQNVFQIGSEVDNTAWVLDVFFVNRARGWVVGRDGLILRTSNSGKTWERAQLDLSTAAVTKAQ
jgi:photosystem II stability/assembly factor-like uncharacterized protein